MRRSLRLTAMVAVVLLCWAPAAGLLAATQPDRGVPAIESNRLGGGWLGWIAAWVRSFLPTEESRGESAEPARQDAVQSTSAASETNGNTGPGIDPIGK